ncbi:MAG: hypothetical protein ACRDNT_26690 [Streptosporangiaceae bacterium]
MPQHVAGAAAKTAHENLHSEQGAWPGIGRRAKNPVIKIEDLA